MTKHVGLIVVIVICLLCLIVPLSILLTNQSALVFDPVLFANMYLGFSGNVISVLLSFFLLQIYWERRQRYNMFRNLQLRVGRGLRELEKTVQQALTLLTCRVEENSSTSVEHQEDKILECFVRSQAISSGIVTYLSDMEVIDSAKFSAISSDFLTVVMPSVTKLAGRKSIYPEIETMVEITKDVLGEVTKLKKAVEV